MKRDRLSFIASFMPPLCMAFMLGFEYLIDNRLIAREEYIVAAAEVLPFLLPFLLAVLLRRILGSEKAVSRTRGFTRHGVPFVLLMSLTTALLSFLLNSGLSLLFEQTPASQVRYADSLSSLPVTLLLVVLLPSVFEELFFRDGILGAFEGHGTLAAIFVSALSFALVHGNTSNLIGPFAAGLVYGYMTYALGSVWPAVFAHMVNNCFFLLVGYFTRSYESLGIWPYFLLATVFVFSLLAYFSMRSLEKLITRGKIRRFRPGGLRGFASALMFSPGLWLLALMFVIKVAYL